MREKVDIFISGGGPAGLIAAAAFGALGLTVLVADPALPVTVGDREESDLRSTAFLHPARRLFDEIGLWPTLAPQATPLAVLEIVDCTGDPPEPRERRAFRGDELGEAPLGWNFMNWKIREVLVGHLATLPEVELAFGTGFRRLVTRTGEALVTLSDGRQVSARLAIAADGRNSALREAAGIGVQTTRYGQKALAFAVTHPVAHGNVSTEIYHEGGPFTMVPLPDHRGLPCSAIVWMNPGPRTHELAALSDAEFNAAATRRSAGLFGPLEIVSPRNVWPVITQRANALSAERVALVAEAAHVLPPIGAQGLNTSVNDIAALVDLARQDPAELGSAPMLAAYERRRAPDIAARARAIDLFNRVTRAPDRLSQSLRRLGLVAVHDLAPLRSRLMRAGMGPEA
jgi:2-octaprenyl-6-methoxyphenol hydroxylase